MYIDHPFGLGDGIIETLIGSAAAVGAKYLEGEQQEDLMKERRKLQAEAAAQQKEILELQSRQQKELAEMTTMLAKIKGEQAGISEVPWMTVSAAVLGAGAIIGLVMYMR